MELVRGQHANSPIRAHGIPRRSPQWQPCERCHANPCAIGIDEPGVHEARECACRDYPIGAVARAKQVQLSACE